MNKGKIRFMLEKGKIVAKHFIREYGLSLGIGIGGGMLIGGYFGAIENSRQISKLGRCHNDLVDTVNQHADAGNDMLERMRKDEQDLEDLKRQNALLMERALNLTEGKG